VTDTTNSALHAAANVSVTTTAQILAIGSLSQTATAGTPQNLTVTLFDNFGNVATGYVGAVHFTSSDSQAALPTDYTFTAADQGKHTFQVTWKTSGPQSIVVTDVVNGALTASANVTVGTAAEIVALTGLGQSSAAGTAQSLAVSLTDEFGNVATGYLGTVHFSSSDGRAALPCRLHFHECRSGHTHIPVHFQDDRSAVGERHRH